MQAVFTCIAAFKIQVNAPTGLVNHASNVFSRQNLNVMVVKLQINSQPQNQKFVIAYNCCAKFVLSECDKASEKRLC